MKKNRLFTLLITFIALLVTNSLAKSKKSSCNKHCSTINRGASSRNSRSYKYSGYGRSYDCGYNYGGCYGGYGLGFGLGFGLGGFGTNWEYPAYGYYPYYEPYSPYPWGPGWYDY